MARFYAHVWLKMPFTRDGCSEARVPHGRMSKCLKLEASDLEVQPTCVVILFRVNSSSCVKTPDQARAF